MADNSFSLERKVILVTGASSGIGRACAIECARAGASVVATGRDRARLEETYDALPLSRGIYSTRCAADLTNEKDLERLLGACPAPYDGVVHAAGICETRPFAFLNRKKLQQIFDVNLFAPAILTQRLLRQGSLNPGCSLVFISSIDGPLTAHIGNSMYAMSKGALSALVKTIALELAEKKIRANAILPGMTETPLIHNGRISEEQLSADEMNYPLERYGKPEEIAYAVRYLLSDASAWTTGAQLVIDGGVTIR